MDGRDGMMFPASALERAWVLVRRPRLLEYIMFWEVHQYKMDRASTQECDLYFYLQE
jgi:hypothetical protein